MNNDARQSTPTASVPTERRPGRALPRLISLVVPVYNEQASIALFLERVDSVLSTEGLNYEIVFVNDGSRDATLETLELAMQSHPCIRLVDLTRNFGKEAALTAGLDFALGDVVIPMDVDLQDPPELIPQFVAKWREGFDVVNGKRVDRSSDTLLKRNSSLGFYWLFNKLSRLPLPENVGDFRLLDRRVVEAVKQMPERNRFMKGIFAWVGFRSCDVPYQRPHRAAGTTSWNYWKLWNLALDGWLGYSTVPLRVWTYFGFLLSLAAFLYGILVVIKTLIYGIDVPGYASLISVLLFMSGIQIMSLGIIGEYIGRIFLEVKQRPVYLVRSLRAGTDVVEGGMGGENGQWSRS